MIIIYEKLPDEWLYVDPNIEHCVLIIPEAQLSIVALLPMESESTVEVFYPDERIGYEGGSTVEVCLDNLESVILPSGGNIPEDTVEQIRAFIENPEIVPPEWEEITLMS